MPPFLEVITRTFNARPRMFAAHQLSLMQQTDRDFVHTVLMDSERRGIGWATENMARHADRLTGDWVWILDDDDELILPTFVAGLKQIAIIYAPDIVMVRMDHGAGRILPSARWGKSPKCSEIGVSAFVVRREVWQAHAGTMIPGEYVSDFKFIHSIWQERPRVYWWDVVASRVQVQSMGQPERETA